MKCLQDELEKYMHSDYYPFHMPGHKRNIRLMNMENPYGLDITEIDGFDNLHMADGILKELMEEAAVLYGADETMMLINGSTCGILISMAAVTSHGDSIIMARNCHRAAYHGVYLNELKPIYLYPQEVSDWGISGPILPEDVDKALKENPDAKMVMITSPTYEGIVSDIEKIAKVVHAYGIPLIVDEAHGAHFGFDPYFPQNSIRLGADLVINSVHKTLPAFTQTALLSVRSEYVDVERVKRFSAMYQSSSPSYLFMAGIQKSLRIMSERKDLIHTWIDHIEKFHQDMKSLKYLRLFETASYILDRSKIIISVKNTTMTGAELYDILRENYHLQMEAEYANYIIAMTSIADTREGFERLTKALIEIDEQLEREENTPYEYPVLPRFERVLNPYDTDKMKVSVRSLQDSIGGVSAEYAFLYPPGIPLIVPGERITEELPDIIEWYKKQGLVVKGLQDSTAECIRILGGNQNG